MTSNSRAAVNPRLSEDEKRGMADFLKVYDAAWDEVQAAVLDEARRLPEFEAILRKMDPEQTAAQSRASRSLLRSLAETGDWSVYLQSLREQGRTYAGLGVSFRTWFELTAAFQKIVFPRLTREFGADGERLARAALGTQLFLEIVMSTIGDEYLAAKEELIRQQQRALLELSTPVLQVRDRMLILPIIGVLDTRRARQLTQQLLSAIRANRALAVIMDITGVPAVDSKVANHLLQTVAAARLMGARVVVSGLSGDVAEALVTLGVDLERMTTVGDLQTAMETAEAQLGYRLVRMDDEAHGAPKRPRRAKRRAAK